MNNELFSVRREDYGDQYTNHLFDQYKFYIESAEKVSDRRQNANNHFIAINTALISLLGVSAQIKILQDLGRMRVLFSILGLLICIIFWNLIRSYKQLNAGKFAVIHEIEKQLPLSLYRYEWKILAEGKKPKIYYPFSHIELLIPQIFGLIYLILGFLFIFPL